MQPHIAEIREFLAARRADLHGAAAHLSPAQWATRPSADRWSVAEVYQHLYLVERSVTKMLRQKVADARASGHPTETDMRSRLALIDWRPMLDRRTPRSAPPNAEPREAPDEPTARRQLSESRADLYGVMDDANGLELGTLRHMHGAIGDVDLYQWMLFVGHHEARHTAQVAEIATAVSAHATP